jgi:hypothetical protein
VLQYERRYFHFGGSLILIDRWIRGTPVPVLTANLRYLKVYRYNTVYVRFTPTNTVNSALSTLFRISVAFSGCPWYSTWIFSIRGIIFSCRFSSASNMPLLLARTLTITLLFIIFRRV